MVDAFSGMGDGFTTNSFLRLQERKNNKLLGLGA